MKNMINVGNEVTNSDVTVAAAAEAITAILETGAVTHTEQETIRAAIKVIGDLSPVKNVNISSNSFMNTPPRPAPLLEDDDLDDLDD